MNPAKRAELRRIRDGGRPALWWSRPFGQWLARAVKLKDRAVIMRFLTGLLTVSALCNLILAQTNRPTRTASPWGNQDMNDFQVFEFRRYSIKAGERQHFAQYFESYFPEVFPQLGSLAACS